MVRLFYSFRNASRVNHPPPNRRKLPRKPVQPKNLRNINIIESAYGLQVW